MSQMTFYPDAHVESTSVDGNVSDSTSNQTWAAKRAAAGSNSVDSSLGGYLYFMGASVFPDLWDSLHRAIILFDTSALPDTASISSAYIEVYVDGKNNNLSISPRVGVYGSNPASNTALVAGDFDSVGGILLSNSIVYADIAVMAYNRFDLNGSGIGTISKTGVSKFSFREVTYDAGGSAPTWTSGQYSRVFCKFAEYGLGYRPRLVVIYTAPAVYYEEAVDGIKFSDAPSSAAVSDGDVSDGIEFGDSAVAITKYPRTATDGIEFSDSARVDGAEDEEVVDGIVFSDSAEYDVGAGVFERTATDGIVFSDHAAKDIHVSVTDGIVFSDSTDIPAGNFFIEVIDKILFSDEPIAYRGPHVVRNLLDVRQKFIRLSGREDLAITSHQEHDLDDGADFFIRAGSRYLDTIQPTHHEFTWHSEALVAGDYASKFMNCRAIKEVFFVNAAGEEVPLDKMLFAEFLDEYPEQGSTEQGTPADYAMYPQQRPPAQLDEGEDYDYVGIRIMPPTDASITLRVYGLFTSNPLIQNVDENYWSVAYPDVLVLAALMKLKGLYEDASGAKGHRVEIEHALLGVDKDVADYIEDEGMVMHG